MKGNQLLHLGTSSRLLGCFGIFFSTRMFLVVMSLNWFGLDAPQSLGFDFLQENMD